MPKTKDQRLSADPMLVWLEQGEDGHSSIEFLRYNLREKYTLSTRDICRVFKCRRAWVSSSIRPNVHHIYAAQKDIYRVVGPSASDDVSSTWYDRAEVIDLFKRYGKVQERTRRVDIGDVVVNRTAYEERRDLLKTSNLYPKAMRREMMEYLLRLNEPDVTQLCWSQLEDPKLCRWVDVDVDDSFWEKAVDEACLQVSGDLQEYGDTEKDLQLMLMRRCAKRVELTVPDKDGRMPAKARLLYKLDDEPEGVMGVDYFVLPVEGGKTTMDNCWIL